MNNKYSSNGNSHSGQYVAFKAEEKGAKVSCNGNSSFHIEAPNGDYYTVPNRSLYPGELRKIKSVLKIMGLLLLAIILVAWFI